MFGLKIIEKNGSIPSRFVNVYEDCESRKQLVNAYGDLVNSFFLVGKRC